MFIFEVINIHFFFIQACKFLSNFFNSSSLSLLLFFLSSILKKDMSRFFMLWELHEWFKESHSLTRLCITCSMAGRHPLNYFFFMLSEIPSLFMYDTLRWCHPNCSWEREKINVYHICFYHNSFISVLFLKKRKISIKKKLQNSSSKIFFWKMEWSHQLWRLVASLNKIWVFRFTPVS